jgi:hypothetical protein
MEAESNKSANPTGGKKKRELPREDWSKGTDEVDGLKEARVALAKQAKALLAGEAKWRPTVVNYPRPTYK